MITRQHPLIAESGAKNSKCLPAPSGGKSCFTHRSDSPATSYSGTKLVIFHNRQVGEAAHFFKQRPGEEKPLVPVRSLEPA